MYKARLLNYQARNWIKDYSFRTKQIIFKITYKNNRLLTHLTWYLKNPLDEKPKERVVAKPALEEQPKAVIRSTVKSADPGPRAADKNVKHLPAGVARAQSAEPKKRSENESKVNTEVKLSSQKWKLFGLNLFLSSTGRCLRHGADRSGTARLTSAMTSWTPKSRTPSERRNRTAHIWKTSR